MPSFKNETHFEICRMSCLFNQLFLTSRDNIYYTWHGIFVLIVVLCVQFSVARPAYTFFTWTLEKKMCGALEHFQLST